jgi:hypothetical protein
MKEGLCYIQFRRSVLVKAGRQMFTFLPVSDCVAHNRLGSGPLRDICRTADPGREARSIFRLFKCS